MSNNPPGNPGKQIGTHCPYCDEKFQGMMLIPLPSADLEIPLPVRATTSEIDEEGLGPEVLRLRGSGLTLEEIGKRLGYSLGQVQNWLQNYNTMLPAQRRQIQQRNIFNVADELQTHYSELLGMWREATELDNKDLKLKVLQEARKYMDLSGRLVEKLEQFKNDQAYKDAVLDILETFNPGTKAQALKKIAEFKQGINLLRPI